MSLDERLRRGLEGLDFLERLPAQSVVEAVVDRGRRSRRSRRFTVGAIVVAAVFAALVVAPKALDALRGAREPHPALPSDGSGRISTVAGTGAATSSGDGGPAAEADISLPSVIGFDAEGNLYINDGDIRIRKIDSKGVITTVVGPPVGMESNLSRDLSGLYGHGAAVDADGNLYIWGSEVGSVDMALLKVTPSGDVMTLAGTGHAGCSGDGRLATQARLDPVYAGVAVDAEGNIYVTQSHKHCVRKIDAAGIITTIAGTGMAGFSGDGGPAVEAQLHGPTNVSLDTGGNIYISDTENHRIRRIDPLGIISTVAGNGEGGFPQDGTVATQVPIGGADVNADGGGNIYITDEGYPGIFKVDAEGILTIVAGTGVDGYSGDRGLATEARLSEPTSVAVGPDGDLYVADWGNNRIRRVDL